LQTKSKLSSKGRQMLVSGQKKSEDGCLASGSKMGTSLARLGSEFEVVFSLLKRQAPAWLDG